MLGRRLSDCSCFRGNWEPAGMFFIQNLWPAPKPFFPCTPHTQEMGVGCQTL